ncbi:MAG: tetratricopeptide repeat protein [Candidatus Omnitrophica bacterium]|nr:tetratricopeptide repeat protein [Candidatus Omnitrophota bacterium]
MKRFFGVFCFCCCLLGAVPRAWALPGAHEVAEGNALYKKGDYKASGEKYEAAQAKSPEDAVIAYDMGAALYKAGDFDGAAHKFQQALLSDDEKFKGSVHYNLGNTLYQQGLSSEDRDAEAAIKKLEEATPHYDKAIEADPKALDAAGNRDFVRQEIERLKKKLEQQKQQQRSNGQSGKDQKNGQDGKDQQSGKDQQGGKDQKPQESQGAQDQSQNGAQGQENKSQAGQEAKDAQAKPEHAPGQDEKQGAAGQGEQGKLLSSEEAAAVLDDFDRNEQPKGLLNFIQKHREERAVEKDW